MRSVIQLWGYSTRMIPGLQKSRRKRTFQIISIAFYPFLRRLRRSKTASLRHGSLWSRSDALMFHGFRSPEDLLLLIGKRKHLFSALFSVCRLMFGSDESLGSLVGYFEDGGNYLHMEQRVRVFCNFICCRLRRFIGAPIPFCV